MCNKSKVNKYINLKIVQWNSRSLSPKISELETYLVREKIHICICTETWLSSEKRVSVPGFYCFREDREDEHGGVAIFVHNSIKAKLVTTNIPNCRMELICIQIISFSKIKNIIAIYSPQNVNVSRSDYDNLFSFFDRNTLIAGDFNGHHAAWSYKTDTRGRLIAEASIDHNFVYLNDGEHTRFAMHNGEAVLSAPDITFASSDIALDFDWSVTNECFGSDHRLVLLKLHDLFSYVPPSSKRNIKSADWHLYEQEVGASCVDFALNNDLQDCYDRLLVAINSAADKAIPYTRFPENPHSKFTPKSWWNQDLSKIVAERRLALKNFRKNRSAGNFDILQNKVREARHMIRAAKRESWKRFCNSIDAKTLCTDLWKKLRWLKGYRAPKKRDFLQDEFAESFLASLSPDCVSSESRKINGTSLESHPFTLSELNAVLKKKDTSAGLDNIVYSMIFHLPPDVKVLLLYIYNLIYISGLIPSQWRNIKIIAIPKQNNNTCKFRPISLLNCICKIFNLMVTKRLEHFFESKKLFNEHTLGFRRGFSCVDNLSRFVMDAEIALTNKEYMLCGFCDISDAYNNVSIDCLFNCLVSFGLDPYLCVYINEFLKERHLFLFLQNGECLSRLCRQGLCQGDPMSPILFNIITINLSSKLPLVRITQYADDFTFYYVNKDIQCCVENMEISLNVFSMSLREVGLDLSYAKTKLCILTRKYKVPSIEIKINGEQIDVVKCTKFLGMWIDSRLNWTKHIDELVSKCVSYINIFKYLCNSGLHPLQLRRLYGALVQSRIDYGNFLYDSASTGVLRKVELIQNQGLRACGGFIRTTPIHVMQSELSIMPLRFRRQYLCHKYMLKVWSRSNDYLSSRIATFLDLLLNGARYWRRTGSVLLVDTYKKVREFEVSQNQTPLQYQLPFLITRLPLYNIISIDIKSITTTKKQTIEYDYNNAFASMLENEFHDFVQIYTDASKDKVNAGCSFFDHSRSFNAKFKIDNKHIPIMGLELLAILKSISYAESCGYRKFVIFTDSASSLHHLLSCGKGTFGRQEAYSIIKCIWYLIDNGVQVRLQWVPSHVGIRGNEVADAAARSALTNGAELKIQPCHFDYLAQVRESIYKLWKTAFCQTSREKGIWYGTIVREPPRVPWFSACSLSKRELILCMRIRSGHVPLGAFRFLMRLQDSPNCATCHNVKEDLYHRLMECVQNEPERAQLLQDTGHSRYELFFFLHNIFVSGFKCDYSDRVMSFLVCSFLKDVN